GQRYPVPSGDRPNARLHGAGGDLPGASGDDRGDHLSSGVPAARTVPRYLHPADDCDPGRHRPGVDDDVPPTTRRAELPAVAGRPATLALDLLTRYGDSGAGCGRNLAMDAARDADRARWPGFVTDRAAGVGCRRWRGPVANLPRHHPAIDPALPDGRGGTAH